MPAWVPRRRLHVATHYQVALAIVAEPEDVLPHDRKAPLSIEGEGSRVSFPYSEPERRGLSGHGSCKNVRHEFVSQSGPVVCGIHVEPLDLDRSRARNRRARCIESELHVRGQASPGFGNPGLATRLTNLRELQGFAIGRRTVRLHVRIGIRPRKGGAEGSFGEHRKFERVVFVGSPDQKRSLH